MTVLVAQSCLTFRDPRDCSRQTPLSMAFSRQDTGVGSHSLLQGVFPTYELNPVLLHCRQILYCLSQQGQGYNIGKFNKFSLILKINTLCI